jgi:DNA repair photolyase
MITKSPLIVRDIDLLTRFEYNEVTLTITTLNEKLCKILEPEAPSPSSRLGALKKLSAQGLNTYAFVGPLYPTLEPEDIPEFVEKLANSGVGTIMVDKLNRKPGIWNDIEAALTDQPEVRDIFYERLFTDKKYYSNIFQDIEKYCKLSDVKFEGVDI